MTSIAKTLSEITFKRKEEKQRHHTYDEELMQYEYMKNGNMDAIPLGIKLFQSNTTGTLSDHPVMNYKYLFVASITLSSRFCIEGGMYSEDAYNLSDLYIRLVDKCKTVEEIFALHNKMFTDYTKRMSELKKEKIYSKPVLRCIDYIDLHLHETITVKSLAQYVSLSPTYLSALFSKETGTSISEYIREKRINTAITLLKYSEYTCMEIANNLGFSSQSHFNKLFKQYTGLTPKEYRLKYFRLNWTK
ncbi:AraC family transcriptional regulator [Domibacillus sp. DTU_2020_1001157_1_SI_ALB_TIR_016]|uniref:helix-turn-helix domain-containing protein n=1 Tax=Domibacillus sp. DTU_2020_1001157_1_SI_ALB_TIR_016 TaxID=3077789 RepID=UPI0028E513D5|nr:AraC family transcriptional regulator [Domibacillus sp. DTU_2020_1001157_1_SI_ALB_TIR_016]WNS82274.1 AraC family transcriptional regulator [Domibacillus sp. DTU_2020_1001157_1_SI_ALB_TIR_016]